MPLKFGNNEVEKVHYSSQEKSLTNVQINIVKYINRSSSVNEIVFQGNLIKAGTYTGNPTISALATAKTCNINFSSNNENFTSFVFASDYFKYGDTSVYSYANNSWVNAYKVIVVAEDTYVDEDVADWFGINYIKS
jgi:hypothetical protein